MLSDFELTRIAKLIDPQAGGMFQANLKRAAKAGAEEMFKRLLPVGVEFGYQQCETGHSLEQAQKYAMEGEPINSFKVQIRVTPP